MGRSDRVPFKGILVDDDFIRYMAALKAVPSDEVEHARVESYMAITKRFVEDLVAKGARKTPGRPSLLGDDLIHLDLQLAAQNQPFER